MSDRFTWWDPYSSSGIKPFEQFAVCSETWTIWCPGKCIIWRKMLQCFHQKLRKNESRREYNIYIFAICLQCFFYFGLCWIEHLHYLFASFLSMIAFECCSNIKRQLIQKKSPITGRVIPEYDPHFNSFYN